jgi:serpin B
MGIRKAFDMDAADFSALTDSDDYPFYIGDVLHKARIKVDETGSEAAAITDIAILTTGIHGGEPPVVEFHCDRPFLYVITEVSSGAIYFIGQYTGK